MSDKPTLEEYKARLLWIAQKSGEFQVTAFIKRHEKMLDEGDKEWEAHKAEREKMK